MRSRVRYRLMIGWSRFLVAGWVACALCSCATSGGRTSAVVEIEEDGSFSITEPVRLDSDVRDDFETALELIEEERIDEGIALLERVTEAAPTAAVAHIDLGIAHRMNGEYASAEAAMLKALELNARHPVALNELGMVYRRMGRFDDARESYERALAVSSEFHYARRNLAILCDVFLGDLACALEHYERYARVVPDDEQVAMWITDVRNRLGKQ